MPVVQIDWGSVKGQFSGDTGLYILTYQQAALLLALSEQLTWEKTFRDWGYDFSDWDTLQSEVADLQKNLIMPADIGDIIALIDEVESLLRAIASHADCCNGPQDPSDGDFYTDDVLDGVGDVPQNIIDAGYASDSSDWDGFDDYKCMIAHVTVDHIEGILRALLPHFDSTGVIIGGVGTVASLLGAIVTVAGGPIIIGILASVAAAAALWALITAAGEEITEGLADKVAANHDDLACAIYFADGPAAAKEALYLAIDDSFTATEAAIIKQTNIGPTLKALYGGRYDQLDVAEQLAEKGYDVGDFDCIVCLGDYPLSSQVRGLYWKVTSGSFTSFVAEKPYGFKKLGSGDFQFATGLNQTSALATDTALGMITATSENNTVGEPTDFIGLRFTNIGNVGRTGRIDIMQMYDYPGAVWRDVTGLQIRATSRPDEVSVDGTELVFDNFGNGAYNQYVEFYVYW